MTEWPQYLIAGVALLVIAPLVAWDNAEPGKDNRAPGEPPLED